MLDRGPPARFLPFVRRHAPQLKRRSMPSSPLSATNAPADLTPVRSAGEWPHVPVCALYLVLFAGMTWRWIAGLVTIPWDAKAHFLPQVQFLAQSLARGDWP